MAFSQRYVRGPSLACAAALVSLVLAGCIGSTPRAVNEGNAERVCAGMQETPLLGSRATYEWTGASLPLFGARLEAAPALQLIEKSDERGPLRLVVVIDEVAAPPWDHGASRPVEKLVPAVQYFLQVDGIEVLVAVEYLTPDLRGSESAAWLTGAPDLEWESRIRELLPAAMGASLFWNDWWPIEINHGDAFRNGTERLTLGEIQKLAMMPSPWPERGPRLPMALTLRPLEGTRWADQNLVKQVATLPL
jgi:hypothetical protein